MGLQKQAHNTNLGWKGVTPSAQACKLYIMATQSQFWEPQLKCKESVEYYCTEMHMGVTCDWLLHMHGCHVKDKWHVKMKFCKGQELAKASKCKARKLREQMHRDSWDWRRERQKTSRVKEHATFSIQLFLARPHWLLLVIIYYL